MASPCAFAGEEKGRSIQCIHSGNAILYLTWPLDDAQCVTKLLLKFGHHNCIQNARGKEIHPNSQDGIQSLLIYLPSFQLRTETKSHTHGSSSPLSIDSNQSNDLHNYNMPFLYTKNWGGRRAGGGVTVDRHGVRRNPFRISFGRFNCFR